MGVAAVGATLWTLRLDAILLDPTVDQVFVLIVFPPLFVASGFAWGMVNRVPIGILVFLIRAVTVAVMMYFLLHLLALGGPRTRLSDRPEIAFFTALSVSITVVVASVRAWWQPLVVIQRMRGRRFELYPAATNGTGAGSAAAGEGFARCPHVVLGGLRPRF